MFISFPSLLGMRLRCKLFLVESSSIIYIQMYYKWLSWDKLIVPKKFKDPDFRIYAFNLAMLDKQAWKFIDQPQSSVARIYWVEVFYHGGFLNVELVIILLMHG